MLQYALHQSTLGGSHGIVPMMACFPKYAKEYVTVLARLWSSKIGVADDDDESDDEEKEDNDKEDEEDDDQSSSEDEDEDQDSETEDAEQVAQRLEKQAKQKKKRAAKKAKARANKKSSAKAASASSSATSIKNGYESVRVVAFLGMRKLAVVAPSYVDLILKVKMALVCEKIGKLGKLLYV